MEEIADPVLLEALVEIGIEKSVATLALVRTNSASVESALDWVIENPEEIVVDSVDSSGGDPLDDAKQPFSEDSSLNLSSEASSATTEQQLAATSALGLYIAASQAF